MLFINELTIIFEFLIIFKFSSRVIYFNKDKKTDNRKRLKNDAGNKLKSSVID